MMSEHDDGMSEHDDRKGHHARQAIGFPLACDSIGHGLDDMGSSCLLSIVLSLALLVHQSQ